MSINQTTAGMEVRIQLLLNALDSIARNVPDTDMKQERVEELARDSVLTAECAIHSDREMSHFDQCQCGCRMSMGDDNYRRVHQADPYKKLRRAGSETQKKGGYQPTGMYSRPSSPPPAIPPKEAI